MKVDGKDLRPIWPHEDQVTVQVIDQRRLPHEFVVLDINSVDDCIHAIEEMVVRGAPLIGVTAAYGVYLAALTAVSQSDPDVFFKKECRRIKAARPTAVNLAWAVDRVARAVETAVDPKYRARQANAEAERIAEEEADNCRKIGEHGVTLIETVREKKGGAPVNILTHCNAGWLACIECGTATAPMYMAFEKGIDIHVWVDETRPLNQGARLTAWELGKCGIAHTVITDNAGGHLMQHGMVDLVIVGTDRTTGTGDVANKIGTYLKALAARDNDVPFYVALPSSTFDWDLTDGVSQIPIEKRDPDEVRIVEGRDNSVSRRVLVPPADSPAVNYAFDVTPARLVTGFITERGICRATTEDIRRLFPEKATPDIA
ncbi:S-methyl-5-thioribose-1-phosphate isomerase (EC [Olavius algarvensis associated proteobacterium Delta 3]|nr:S-methyl-5-thioribose-1-phosphate isomerase (EC [Olavius algarvensis associated proteobacterium Delta 3]CAB5150141.1 S-methyl-5-thioribose-1-phosphate isomerase (EC [Olavius algarvensis associated proteobacterium Delta 3]